jgi:hypothetical protein
MTDEWPFIDQRIPDREVVFTKVDPGRKLEVVEEEEEGFDDLGFSFTDSPDDAPVAGSSEDRVTETQAMVYDLINGRDTVNEIIQESPYIEFDTCKAVADLLDRSLIRRASPEEVARQLSRVEVPEREPAFSMSAIPWLALPFLVLLGFSLTIMTHNPVNPGFSLRSTLWNQFVLEAQSWFTMSRVSSAAETSYYLNGLYPESLSDVERRPDRSDDGWVDPWGREYRLVTRGSRLMVTGFDSSGQPVPMLIQSRSFAWEGTSDSMEDLEGPGVILLNGS